MKKNRIVFCILSIVLMFGLFGCKTDNTNENRKKLTDEDVICAVSEYLSEKYGEVPKIGKIEKFEDISGGIDATYFTEFAGYAIETGDFYTFMEIEEETGDFYLSDNKQKEQIREAVCEVLDDSFDGEWYLSLDDAMPETVNGKEIPYASEAKVGYHALFDGNLSQLYEEEKHDHPIIIYLEPADGMDAEECVKQVVFSFAAISSQADIYMYERGIYEYLRPYFGDDEYMYSYHNGKYLMAYGDTYDDTASVECKPFIELADGIYYKCDTDVEIFAQDNLQEGYEKLSNLIKEKNTEETEYLPTGREKYILIAEDDVSIILLVSKEKLAKGQCFELDWGEVKECTGYEKDVWDAFYKAREGAEVFYLSRSNGIWCEE